MRCAAENLDGEKCGGYAVKGSQYCFAHDPRKAADRQEARRRGGERVRPGHAGEAASVPASIRDLAGVLELLDYATAETLVLENSIARGRLLVALASTYLEAVKVSDLEERIKALEAVRYGQLGEAYIRP